MPEEMSSPSADSATVGGAPAQGASLSGGASAAPSPAPCTRCGADAPYDFGDIWLCLDCYHIAGSTCSGIGRAGTPADPVC